MSIVDEEQDHVETMAEALYRELGARPGDVWPPSEIAERLGLTVVRSARARARGRFDARTRTITVQANLPAPIEEWTIGHEIGHARGLTNERACDLFGACLQMRRGPFAVAMSEHGEAWHELAERFGVTSTSAALRAAEIDRIPLAVVLPGRGLYMRNIQADRDTVRRLARHGGPGIRRAELADDPGRIVVIAATEETG